ncbi:MCE family protein [Actinomadura sp. HBU206391]|uniref:MCE family protein n=1 Tax=Actinomadura sp. HBU206391 TaxID=2731692 RepID=UPI00164EE65A|nr:MCE family protein [Actinomadura sp. HBU206391]MBC6460077.1 MCE family protein [Actinomadura sp. HBU206391]
MTRSRAFAVTAAVASIAVSAAAGLTGCTGLKSPPGKHMTVYFARTTSFYEQSKVKIMGIDVGTVEKVRIDGGRIRVDFTVREDVPVPRDVNAAIVPLNLVGERNLVLSPPWRPGMPLADDGTVIPQERTTLPVETDDALKAFTNLANALDPTKVRGSVGDAADSFRGNGTEFNSALQQSARLTANLAGQDRQLLEVARNLSRLAGTVRGHEQTLGSMISGFSTATKVFAAERQELQQLIRGLLQLANQGSEILTKYEGQLPGDLAVLTRVALTLQGQSRQLALMFKALPGVSEAFINAYDPASKSLVLRFPTDAFLRTWLQGLSGGLLDGCPLPPPNSNCPWQGDR